MKEYFREIFEYHHYYNQKLIGEIKTNFETLPQKTFPLFCHVLNAHQVWNSRILQFTPPGVWEVHPIDNCFEMDSRNFSDTLKILDSEDMERLLTYKTSKGEEFTNKIKDILFHVVNHSTHHKGQIISDFRSQGIQPLVTDFIFYKRQADLSH